MKDIRTIFLILTALLPITGLFWSASWAQTELKRLSLLLTARDFVRINTYFHEQRTIRHKYKTHSSS